MLIGKKDQRPPATPKFCSAPRPCWGRCFLAPRDPGDPATLPTLKRGRRSGEPTSVSAARNRSGTLTRGGTAPAGQEAPIGPWLNRLLGCLTPLNQQIVTPMLQHGVQRCRHPRTVPLAFGDSEQFDGLALMRGWTRIACGRRCQRRLPADAAP
jgi:hypothetical protein